MKTESENGNRNQGSIHVPVLLYEVVNELAGVKNISLELAVSSSPNVLSSGTPLVYLDGTLGGAGHAKAIAEALHGKVTVVGLDRDQRAIERARETLKGKADRVILENEDYRNLDKALDKNGISSANLILLDLGISSDQLDSSANNSGRGFSFLREEPLLMTMGEPSGEPSGESGDPSADSPTTYPFTAGTIVNEWEEETIANVIFGYGEERFARRIARAIIAYREKKKIETTTELAEIIKSAIPGFYRRGKIHPATKTFQALRIAVNDELGALKEGLEKGFGRLASGGRMAVISFHSLEDRIVKDFYREKAAEETKSGEKAAIIITKKPITASAQEVAENPRSRSAKLRIIEKSNI